MLPLELVITGTLWWLSVPLTDAAGRNGGHVAPLSFAAFPNLITPLTEGGGGLSPDEALEILEMERENLAYVTELVKREGWEVDLWRGEKLEGEWAQKSGRCRGRADRISPIHRSISQSHESRV
jgi:hypothetical protein